MSLRDRINAKKLATPPTSLKWHEELSAASKAINPSHFDPTTLRRRAELLRDVKTTPHSPHAWHAYLSLLNAERRRHAANAEPMRSALLTVYERATRIVPMTSANRHSHVYVALWLDLAALRAEDEAEVYLAKDVYKHMKLNRIGHAVPAFYNAWAALELRLGNDDKAAKLTREAQQRTPNHASPSVQTPSLSSASQQQQQQQIRQQQQQTRPVRPPRRANQPVDATPSLHSQSTTSSQAQQQPQSHSHSLAPVTPAAHYRASSSSSSTVLPSYSKPPRPAMPSPSITLKPIDHSMSAVRDLSYNTPSQHHISSHSLVAPSPTASVPSLPVVIEQSASPEELRAAQRPPQEYAPNLSPYKPQPQSHKLDRHLHNPLSHEELPPISKSVAKDSGALSHMQRYRTQRDRPNNSPPTQLQRARPIANPYAYNGNSRRTAPSTAAGYGMGVAQAQQQQQQQQQQSGRRALMRERKKKKALNHDWADRQDDEEVDDDCDDVDVGRKDNTAFFDCIMLNQLVEVNGKQYLILEEVGKGGSSTVFKILSRNMKIMALKRVEVRLSATSKMTFDSYANEIALLEKLRGQSSIVELFDSEVRTNEGLICLVMEYGDIDLAKRLATSTTKEKTTINDNFRRLYWHQMLKAVQTIHDERIVHGDLKPANFLIVAGTLKLIDFGIAKAIQTEDTTRITRDAQVGTPNYMSPEAIKEIEGDEGYESGSRKYKVGRASDIWSLGCILYQMVYGRTPFAHLKKLYHKMECIKEPTYEITYRQVEDAGVIDVLKGCLQRDPQKRMSIPELLRHPYICSHTRTESSSSGKGRSNQDIPALLRNVYEATEQAGYALTTFSGERIAIRRGDRMCELMIDLVAKKYTPLPSSNGGEEESGLTSRGHFSKITTPTTSGVTHQASRSGMTRNRTGTGGGNWR